MQSANPSLQKIMNLNFSYKYLTVVEKNDRKVIKGSRGHNSCFFKKPIIQGNYYMEAIGHFPEATTEKYQNGPAFRVGVAPSEYYYNYPLGQDYSVGYKMNGQVIQQGKQVVRLEPYDFGDIIGAALSINEVHKKRDRNKKVESNYVQFYKNGNPVGPHLYLLTEDLYTFSVSLYNESEVELNYSLDKLKHLPPNFSPYLDHFHHLCPYVDPEIQLLQAQIQYGLSHQ